MKSLRYLSGLVVLFITIGFVTTALAAGTVLVTNNTTYTLTAFYASPSDAGDWDTSSDLLAGQTILPGQTGTIAVTDGLGACTYDLMGILYGAAQYAYAYQVDTCGGGSWNISVGD
jgi:hypothetical protein